MKALKICKCGEMIMYRREELETYYKMFSKEDKDFYRKEEADKVMDAMEARINELEGVIQLTEKHAGYYADRIKELESQLPKWISVDDRLPSEEEQYKLLWIAYVRMDNTIKYMYEASFDYETKEFYTENDYGDKTFVNPDIWMVVPQPAPRTEGEEV